MNQRNRMHLVRVHGRPWHLVAHILYAGLLELPAKVAVRTLQGHRLFARACVLGYLDGLRDRMGPGAAPWL
jgi:hypothetical protein